MSVIPNLIVVHLSHTVFEGIQSHPHNYRVSNSIVCLTSNNNTSTLLLLVYVCVNRYFQFRTEDSAEKAVQLLNNRWFNGQPIHAELSPVTDFKEACCRQYDMG